MRQRHKAALQRLQGQAAPRSIEKFLNGTDRNEELDDLLLGVLTSGLRGLAQDRLAQIARTLQQLPGKRKRLLLCLLLSPKRQAQVADLRGDIYGQGWQDNRRFNKLFSDTKEHLGNLRYPLFPDTCLFQVVTVPRQNKQLRGLEIHSTLKFDLQTAATPQAARQLDQRHRESWKLYFRAPNRLPNLGSSSSSEGQHRSSRAEFDVSSLVSEQTPAAEALLRLIRLYEASREEVRSLEARVLQLESELAQRTNDKPSSPKLELVRFFRRHSGGQMA